MQGAKLGLQRSAPKPEAWFRSHSTAPVCQSSGTFRSCHPNHPQHPTNPPLSPCCSAPQRPCSALREPASPC